jgi:iron complex transport system substrate-binding protein
LFTRRRGDNKGAAEVLELNELSQTVIGAAIRIHTRLGPGLMESVYHSVLHRDLVNQGLHIDSKKPISFTFEGLSFENVCVPDLVVDRRLVVEVKSVVALTPVFEKQLLTYLRLLDCKVGLLINFNVALLKDGIKRMVNKY